MGIFDFLRGRKPATPDTHAAPAQPEAGPARRVPVTLPAAAGTLAALDGLDLPAGRLVVAGEHPEAGPIAWASDPGSDQRALWERLVAAYPTTGLWPLVAGDLDDTGRPWTTGEFEGPDATHADAEEVLRRGEVAGLAPGSPASGPLEIEIPDAVARVVLVPAARPADAPASLGWWGPVNYDLSGGDVSAVLRSWEDRFGAVLTGIGFATLAVEANRPPTDPRAIQLLAAELYAFCPDIVDQGVGSVEALGDAVAGRTWLFWWD